MYGYVICDSFTSCQKNTISEYIYVIMICKNRRFCFEIFFQWVATINYPILLPQNMPIFRQSHFWKYYYIDRPGTKVRLGWMLVSHRMTSMTPVGLCSLSVSGGSIILPMKKRNEMAVSLGNHRVPSQMDLWIPHEEGFVLRSNSTITLL